MRCEAAERELSARMDGEPDRSVVQALEVHLAECGACRAFEAGTRRIREQYRLEMAGPVPDHLLASIVASLEPAEAGAGARRKIRALRPALAAFLVGAIASAVLVGGFEPRSPGSALAKEIPGLIAGASAQVDGYVAVFDITERNFHAQIPLRRFETTVKFGARERFRAVTRDKNRYPPGDWPRNDVTLEVDGGRWRLEAPSLCPRLALPACGKPAVQERSVAGREPFDADAILPADFILPLRTLAGSERVDVGDIGRIAGRDVVQVRLAYRDARPLFAFLQSGGSWRPFYPSDQVVVSLDRSNWFPVAYEVRASASKIRAGWAAAQAVSGDKTGQVIFKAVAKNVEFKPDVEVDAIQATPEARDAGFVDLSMDATGERVGFPPLEPSVLQGLSRYRSGAYEGPTRRGESLISYTNGLSWVKIRETRTWNQPALFGNVGPLATPVELPGGGIGYYEPATETLGRRLAIHASDLELYVESNLPGNELLELAGSLPVKGMPIPQEWSTRRWAGGIVREQITLEQAEARAPYLRIPRQRPAGYQVSAVQLVTAGDDTGATVFLRRPGMEADGVGIRVHQAIAESMPPPMDPGVSLVRLGQLNLRYSPSRGEIEWVEDGVYRSITAQLELDELSAMVLSMSTVAGGDAR